MGQTADFSLAADTNRSFEDVLAREHEAINAQRPHGQPIQFLEVQTVRRPNDGDMVGGCFDTVGLALSGGGIRSAAYCTGVLQGLSAHGVLDKIDYLSTVSGGGYAGAAMSVAMKDNNGQFPFLGRTRDEKRDTLAMQELRKNANYLKLGQLGPTVQNLSIYLRGLSANVLYVLPIILILAAFTLLWNPDYASLSRTELPFLPALPLADKLGPYGWTLVLAIAALGYNAIWAVRQSRSAGGELESRWLKPGALVLMLLGIVAFFELQPMIVKSMYWHGEKGTLYNFNIVDRLTALAAPILAAITFASKYLGDILKKGIEGKGWQALTRQVVSKALMIIAGLALPALLWFLYLRLVFWGVDISNAPSPTIAVMPSFMKQFRELVGPIGTDGISRTAIAYCGIAVVLMIPWLFLTPNGNSLHRLYRDRLSKAFFFSVKDGQICSKADVRFSELAQSRPFHLVNATLNLKNASHVNRKGRNADFFTFSPLYCGSEATAYTATKVFEQPASSAMARPLDFATAIAISGAAASSHMGTYSIKLFSVTLALLNVRLGYWFPNPRHLSMVTTGVSRNVLNIVYFVAEAFGLLDAKRDVIYLTDGGHIENLGAYELLRRKCQTVIIVDGEADKQMNFTAFIKLQRYARIDLGARISLPWHELKAVSLAAQANGPEPRPGPHCAIGRIEYEGGGTGVLLYIKASVTGDENDYIRDYNRRHSDFPHETTGDQFFSEEQFEVYRGLGFHIANGLCEGDQLVQTSHTCLESLREAKPCGFGVRVLASILGLSPLPQALLPKRIKEKSEFKPQAVAA